MLDAGPSSPYAVTQDDRTMAILAHSLQVVCWWIAPFVIFLVTGFAVCQISCAPGTYIADLPGRRLDDWNNCFLGHNLHDYARVRRHNS
jgi:hypothetical protein